MIQDCYIPKLNIAVHLIKNLELGDERDRGLAILQATCAEEITLLNQIPNLEGLLTYENLTLLRQLNILS
jgi:hypothetical protein